MSVFSLMALFPLLFSGLIIASWIVFLVAVWRWSKAHQDIASTLEKLANKSE